MPQAPFVAMGNGDQLAVVTAAQSVGSPNTGVPAVQSDEAGAGQWLYWPAAAETS